MAITGCSWILTTPGPSSMMDIPRRWRERCPSLWPLKVSRLIQRSEICWDPFFQVSSSMIHCRVDTVNVIAIDFARANELSQIIPNILSLINPMAGSCMLLDWADWAVQDVSTHRQRLYRQFCVNNCKDDAQAWQQVEKLWPLYAVFKVCIHVRSHWIIIQNVGLHQTTQNDRGLKEKRYLKPCQIDDYKTM